MEREKLRGMERELLLGLLLDIRMIQLCKLPLSENEFRKFVRSLPSQEKYKKDHREPEGVATVTILAPGEIPEWKKELQAKQKKA